MSPTTTSINDRLNGRVLQTCDAIGQFVAYWGFKAIHGRVWTLLALREQPITQAEVAKTLKVSRALVSLAVSELRTYGLVRPTSGRRNASYEAVMDVWPTIADILRSREWMLIESARLALESALEEMRLWENSPRGDIYSSARVQSLLSMTELAQMLLRALIALRAPRAFAGLRGWGKRAGALMLRMQNLRDGPSA